MAVTLSPLGGAAGQFFSNAGVPLAGGKIYTYAAGTTTNKATYTTSSGATAHTNPIILDSNGRIPGGEIWLLSTDSYKFVIKDSTDVLLGTYDNMAGGATSIALDQLIANLASSTGATMIGYTTGTVATALAANATAISSLANKFVNSILDLSTLTYTSVAAGDKVYAKTEDLLFEVLATGATNAPYDFVATGGVKLTFAEGATQTFSTAVKETAFTQQQAIDMAADISDMSGYALTAGTTGGYGYSTYWVTNALTGYEPGSLLWAVEQARTAGGGNVLFFPRGQFNIHLNAQILIPSNVTIDAPGRNVNIWAAFDVTRFKVTGQNVIVRRLAFGATANAATATLRDSIWIYPTSADKVWIDQCSFQWSGDACIDMTTLVELTANCRVTVSRCYFSTHDKGSLIGSLVCYQLTGRPTWCPTALTDQTVRLFVTMRENFWHCVGQRQPKVVSQAFVDSINNAIRMSPFERDDGTTGACYGIFTATGGLARSTNDLFTAASGSGYVGTDASTAAYVPPSSGVLTIEGPGAMDVSGSVAANSITLVEQQTASVPTTPYTITPIAITDTPAGRRSFIESIQANAGAAADNVPAGVFRWDGTSTIAPNAVTQISETNDAGRWLRIDRWATEPDYTDIASALAPVIYPRGSNLTIATGSITAPATGVYFAVDTEGAAATDDLDTIVNTLDYRMIILRSADSTHDVTVKNGTGNIRLASGDYVMSTTTNRIGLIYESPYWYELYRA